jgi:hypothetical protein
MQAKSDKEGKKALTQRPIIAETVWGESLTVER